MEGENKNQTDRYKFLEIENVGPSTMIRPPVLTRSNVDLSVESDLPRQIITRSNPELSVESDQKKNITIRKKNKGNYI